ncbi:glycosyltransferase family 32 protein [Bifidobacterium miconisargentati]|uniref:glycosyltransferase family 32 protein n=1 Tax=Bifidobacterium miconisargentati TaxID=2834437 RepID=UPI001BDCB7B5|nr:glycosyltransferase [Bifidobacterium miconisargentati]MBW3090918.1 glycosyl transferase [Bifidobacterium miconisargentati]
MSIPKIIHYCWFGPNDLPARERACIESWKRLMPDYEIMFWNEETFDISGSLYAKQAYEKGKYAFVSDYARMRALYDYGGVYLDTDVEALSSLDKFLGNKAFVGFENRTMVGTGIIGAEAHSPVIERMLDYYDHHAFVDANGNMDPTTNVVILTDILTDLGFERANSEQDLGEIHVYERDIFCPKKLGEDEFAVTDRSVTIHRFSGSWLTEREKRRGTNVIWRNVFRPMLKGARGVLTGLLGKERTKAIENRIREKLR